MRVHVLRTFVKAHTDRTRFGNATRISSFQWHLTFQCFSNIRNHLSNFSYSVCISCKIFIRWRFYLFLKTENSRRVAESRPVCEGLNSSARSHASEGENRTRNRSKNCKCGPSESYVPLLALAKCSRTRNRIVLNIYYTNWYWYLTLIVTIRSIKIIYKMIISKE